MLENLNKTNHGGERGKDEQCFFEVVKDLTKPGELFRRLKTRRRGKAIGERSVSCKDDG